MKTGLTLREYKPAPLDMVMQRAGPWWRDVQPELTDDQRQTLRPMTVKEVKAVASPLIELGAHSPTHCILKNESRQRRVEESSGGQEWSSRVTPGKPSFRPLR